jgi:hypothetical protein
LEFVGVRFDSWTAQIDQKDIQPPVVSAEILKRVEDWYLALCQHTVLRRAADDAHIALTYPHEALVFVYRGLEWLKEGLAIEWADVACDVGVSQNELRELKKAANHETGVRHATNHGIKMRADPRNYSLWVCGLFDAINGARKRLDPSFQPVSMAETALKAVPIGAYD